MKTIKDMPAHSRSREKLWETGASASTYDEPTPAAAEPALLEANRRLLELFRKKIQAKPAEVWGAEIGAGAQEA